MAKFKRFDPKNRKANHDKFRHREYNESYNEYTKRKAEYDEELRSEFDDGSDETFFQPRRTGVRL